MKEKTSKKKCTFRLSDDTYNYICSEAKLYNISQGELVENIIKHYEKEGYLNRIEDVVKRTHKSISYIDIYSQRILEMLNMMCFSLSCKTAIMDDKIKTEIYEASKELVKERIKKARLNSKDNLY